MSDQDQESERPALGSELAAGVGVKEWPRAWPLPDCHGPLAPFDLRTHILCDVERRLFPVLAAAANGQGPDAERSTTEVRTLAAVLRSLTPKAAESLESAAVTGKGWPSSGAIRKQLDDARHRELERSMPTRWRLANGPALTVDELGPLLSPRNRLVDLAEWLTNSGPRHDEDARAAIRLHVEALGPAEIAVERLEIPVDRARQTREQILTLLDSGSAAAECRSHGHRLLEGVGVIAAEVDGAEAGTTRTARPGRPRDDGGGHQPPGWSWLVAHLRHAHRSGGLRRGLARV